MSRSGGGGGGGRVLWAVRVYYEPLTTVPINRLMCELYRRRHQLKFQEEKGRKTLFECKPNGAKQKPSNVVYTDAKTDGRTHFYALIYQSVKEFEVRLSE